ncbi:hypothetical protein FACS189454_04300 [Planctomycetales bacterium]|nr:hypothetical protein FACS189454_04300 [Planctomycetales bacterium]
MGSRGRVIKIPKPIRNREVDYSAVERIARKTARRLNVDSDSASQEALLKALQTEGFNEMPPALQTTIIKNAVRDFARKERRQQGRQLDDFTIDNLTDAH